MMHISAHTFSNIIFICLLIYTPIIFASNQQDNYEASTDKLLQDILDDVEFAITERNLRIVDRLHIGKSIQERGNPDFPDYEIILYCNLTFAQKMLELAPDFINLCPGRISVRRHGDSFIISAPLWPEQTDNMELKYLMQTINNLVREIVDYAVEDWLHINEK